MRLIGINKKLLKIMLPPAAIILLALFAMLLSVYTAPRGHINIIITEVLASNRGAVLDEDGSSPDYIELYNAGDSDVSLLGWFLSDNSNRPMKWVIPAVEIKSGGYVYFFASGKDKQQRDGIWHTNFQIAGDGTEQIVLSMPDGTVHTHIGPVASQMNVSYGTGPDFKQVVYMTKLTPGEANEPPFFDELTDVKAERVRLVITEYMTANDSYFPDENGLFHDWVEIYNPGSEAVELKGWSLSDNPGRPGKWSFPDDLYIYPGQYLTLHCSGLDLPGHVSFRLSGDDEALVLTDYNGITIDRINVKETPMYASYGRSAGSGFSTEGFFGIPTPGEANADEPVVSVAELRWDKPALLIMEYMTNNSFFMDEDGSYPDWIELYNYGTDSIDLTGMHLSDRGINTGKWSFPEGTYIAAGARLTMWLSGKSQPGHVPFSLSGNDDGIFLSDRYGRMIDAVTVAKLPQNVSAGRDESDYAKWLFFPRATPGAANSTAGFEELAGLNAALWEMTGVSAETISEEIHANRVFPDIDDLIVQTGQLVSLRTDEPGGTIRYTLDGTEPGERSAQYTQPLEIKGNTVLRARVFAQGKEPGAVMTRTYLTDELGASHTVPVIALSSDPDGLFSQSRGIYAAGVDLSTLEFPYQGANFWRDWEREAHFAYYVSGDLHVEIDAGIKIFGQYSRAEPQKAFSVFFREKYGQSKVAYPFIPGISRTLHDAIILRQSGQDFRHTKFKDAFIHNSVMGVTDVTVMGARPVVLYINGEYWGLYNLREKLNEDYFEINEGIPEDEIDIIKGNRAAKAGTNEEYYAMLRELQNMDMNTDEAYAYVNANIDLSNWIDYWITVTYYNNPDTGNIKFYKQQGEGNKWRWILFDQDYAVSSPGTNPFWNMLHPEGHGHARLFSTVIARSLLANDRIRERFIARYAELLKTVFKPERLIAIIDDYAAQIAPEIPAQVERWRAPSSVSVWQSNVEGMRSFVRARGEHIKRHIASTFNLSQAEMEQLFG